MHRPEKFSKDPYENQRIENDLLKLQMIAEFGASYHSGPVGDLDPRLENLFLKQVQQFERAFAHSKKMTVHEKIGKPVFESLQSFSHEDLEEKNSMLLFLLEQHRICIDFINGPYPPEKVYRFITEDLMKEEIEDLDIPSLMIHFIYEEFYPDHKAEIKNKTATFLKHWIDRRLIRSWPFMADLILSPSGTKLNSSKFYDAINRFFESYACFELVEYSITHMDCEPAEHNARLSKLGYSEGLIDYTGIDPNGNEVKIQGPFKIFFSCQHDLWKVNSFVMPGFTWPP